MKKQAHRGEGADAGAQALAVPPRLVVVVSVARLDERLHVDSVTSHHHDPGCMVLSIGAWLRATFNRAKTRRHAALVNHVG